MSDRQTVLISTHDLAAAGPLRDAFQEEGYPVELVTPGEGLVSKSDAALLILTSVVDGEFARDMARVAHDELGVPVFGMFAEGDEAWRRVARELDLAESFVKPADADEVLLIGARRIERLRLRRVTGIVGETDAIVEALERVVQIAPVDSTVLVTGESGTGKELVARGVHALSPRRHKSFIAVNVAALSETLLESELFGHEKGAFTGAIDSRKGLFELASGGTIFLDEIGEMPLPIQTKLLRVLEQREFLRVGGEKSIHVDVRVIAATNQDLRQLVAVGDFRRDLYYRLNVLSIELPPLRERREDIPLLVREFVQEVSSKHDRPFVGISPEAMEILMGYRWPGNVRELRNLVESMVVLAPGKEVKPEDIPDEVRLPGAGKSLLPAARAGVPARIEKGGGGIRPELEFVFRTLVELRVDMDDLRQDFEAYRDEVRGRPGVPLRADGDVEIHVARGRAPSDSSDMTVMDVEEQEISAVELDDDGQAQTGLHGAPAGERAGGEGAGDRSEPGSEDDGVVVYRRGMTMEDMEREAIRAALAEVDGNRRKAAELLEIGERTLYRKIRKFELD